MRHRDRRVCRGDCTALSRPWKSKNPLPALFWLARPTRALAVQKRPRSLSVPLFRKPGHANADAAVSLAGFEPNQIRSAYGINFIRSALSKADGTGQTIAIVDAFNDPHILSDVNAFDQQFTLTSKQSTIFSSNMARQNRS